MATERRRLDRVQFGRGYAVRIMSIDGTWKRACHIEDISDTGARLSVAGSVEGLNLDEFFLVLSIFGKAHRRCQRVWLNGDEVGVRFLKDAPPKPKRNGSRRAGTDADTAADT
jgi:hypothetical protein